MFITKRLRTIAAASILASAALVIGVTTPAAAATSSYKTGTVTCTGTRTGFIVIQGGGTLKVIQSFPGQTGTSVKTTTYSHVNHIVVDGVIQSFSYQVIAQNSASYISSVTKSCAS